jgi:tripartite-type tricarboxylate transporter receptor subunit TctC
MIFFVNVIRSGTNMNALRLLALKGLILACLAPAAAPVWAQEKWPNRPIRVVVTFPPGGTSDLVARVLGPKLATALGQPVVIDNKAGGGGMIGADFVAKSPADGYTFVVSTLGPHSIAPTLNRNIRYNAVSDFTHVALIGSVPHVLLANPKFAAKDLRELVQLARRSPGQYDYASGGSGTINHVIGELFKTAAGISLTHIPYRGSGPAIVDLRGNSVPLAIDALPANVALIRNGDLRAFAITAATRSPMAPEVPTFKELGYPQVVADNWVGISGPAKLSPEITRRLAEAIEQAISQPDVQAKFAEWGLTSTYKGPTDFSAFVAADIALWRPVIVKSGAQVD